LYEIGILEKGKICFDQTSYKARNITENVLSVFFKTYKTRKYFLLLLQAETNYGEKLKFLLYFSLF